jgi:hypothetical protein
VDRASILELQPLIVEKQFPIKALDPFRLHVVPVLRSSPAAEAGRQPFDHDIFLQFKSDHELHVVGLQIYDSSGTVIFPSKRCGSGNRFFVSLGQYLGVFGERSFHVKASWRICLEAGQLSAERQSQLSFVCDLQSSGSL